MDCCIALVYIKGLAGNKFLLSKQKHSYMNKYALAEACARTQSKRDGEQLELKCASDVMFLPQHVCLLIAISPHITLYLMIASSGGCLIRETSPQSQCMLFFSGQVCEA